MKNIPGKLIGLTILFSCFVHDTSAQSQHKKKSQIGHVKTKFSVFTNMISALEGAYGAGISYQLSSRCHVSAEPSYLAGNFAKSTNVAHGFRMTFTAKRFFLKDLLFYGMDARYKFLSYTDAEDFVNPVIPDTLFRYSHHVNKTIYAAGFIFGVKAPFPRTKKIALQVNIGVGLKYRNLNRKNIPSGYKYHDAFFSAKEWFTLDYEGSQVSNFNIYFPAGIRFFYFF